MVAPRDPRSVTIAAGADPAGRADRGTAGDTSERVVPGVALPESNTTVTGAVRTSTGVSGTYVRCAPAERSSKRELYGRSTD